MHEENEFITRVTCAEGGPLGIDPSLFIDILFFFESNSHIHSGEWSRAWNVLIA
jgi:hypothetical protein